MDRRQAYHNKLRHFNFSHEGKKVKMELYEKDGKNKEGIVILVYLKLFL